MLQAKRVYDGADSSDGYRILIDRLWPRGVTKEKAHLDLWAKDVTPSTRLRRDFHHGVISLDDFKAGYLMELDKNPALPPFVDTVREKLKDGNVTFVTAVRDASHSHVDTLLDVVSKKAGIKPSGVKTFS